MKFFADEQDFILDIVAKDFIWHWSGMSCPLSCFVAHEAAVRKVAARYESFLGVAESSRRKALFVTKREADRNHRTLVEWEELGDRIEITVQSYGQDVSLGIAEQQANRMFMEVIDPEPHCFTASQ